MTVRELINDAYVWANVIASRIEQVDSTELARGLKNLNIIARTISITGEEVGLLSEEQFNLAAGITDVDLPDWVDIQKAQYDLGNVLYNITLLTLNQFKNSARITSATGIPYIAFPQRTSTGITLKLFFHPSVDYLMTVTGYKGITTFTDVDTVLSGVEEFIQDYLLFELAAYTADFHDIPRSIFLSKHLNDVRDRIKSIRSIRTDMVMSTLGRSLGYLGLPSSNIGRGYWP